MFKKRDIMKVYAERAKKAWAQRMKNLKIDETNLMVKTDTVTVGGSAGVSEKNEFEFVGGSKKPIVFKEVKEQPKPDINKMLTDARTDSTTALKKWDTKQKENKQKGGGTLKEIADEMALKKAKDSAAKRVMELMQQKIS